MSEEERTPSAILYLYDVPGDELSFEYHVECVKTPDGIVSNAQLIASGLVYSIVDGSVYDEIEGFLEAVADLRDVTEE